MDFGPLVSPSASRDKVAQFDRGTGEHWDVANGRRPDFRAKGIVSERESQLRLHTSVRLRWLAILGQLAAIAIVTGFYGFAMPIASCLVLIAMSAWLNVYLSIRFPARHRLGTTFATSLLVYDILQLGALLYLTGGIQNPFSVLMVAPVTVSAATQPLRSTVIVGSGDACDDGSAGDELPSPAVVRRLSLRTRARLQGRRAGGHSGHRRVPRHVHVAYQQGSAADVGGAGGNRHGAGERAEAACARRPRGGGGA